MYVNQYMKRPVVTISPKTPLSRVQEIFEAHHFRHLPVVDQEGRLMGMITDRDIRSAFPSSFLPLEERSKLANEMSGVAAREVMSPPSFFLFSRSTLDDALTLFQRSKVGALPVVSAANQEVIGMLSLNDMLQAYATLFGLKEKGSVLLTLEDDGKPKPLTRLSRALEENGIRFTRMIRTDPPEESQMPRMIYLRIHTFKLHAVHQVLSAAGFKQVTPELEDEPLPHNERK